MLNLADRELRINRLAGGRFLELPEKLREREQLRPRDAREEMDAVDAEVRQLAQNLGLRLVVLPEEDAVEMGRAVNDVDAQRGRGADVPLHAVVELGQLLFDCWMAGGIESGQTTQADDSLEQRQRIEAMRLGGLGPLRAARGSGL